MTREEAIKILEEHSWSTGEVDGDTCVVAFDAGLDNTEIALEMATSALKEQEEQEERIKGCDYCNDLHPAKDCIIGNVERMFVGRSFADAYVQEREIKFCPYCGRRLEN